MIARRKLAALAFLGGAALALLGCTQAPPPYSGAMPLSLPAAATRSYPGAAAYSYALPTYAPPAPPPQSRTRAPSYPARAAIPEPAPAPQPAKPAAPRDADCPPGSWWDFCHFL
jgi:hypothetical protein